MDNPGGHSTNRAGTQGWSTQQVAIYALFVALGIALSFISFPVFPAVPFLKYDLSGVICLIAAFAYGPAAGATVSILTYVPHLFTNPVGAAMNMLIMLCFTRPAAFIYKRSHTQAGAAAALAAGAVLAVAAALALNLAATPLYYHVDVMRYIALILPAYLPFNLIKMGLHAVITFLCYKPVSRMVKKDS